MTTLEGSAEALYKGAQVMKRIHDDKLMDNARDVGAYLVERLKARDTDSMKNMPLDGEAKARGGPSRGVGMFIFTRSRARDMRDAMGRLLPHLAFTKAEVDALFDGKR